MGFAGPRTTRQLKKGLKAENTAPPNQSRGEAELLHAFWTERPGIATFSKIALCGTEQSFETCAGSAALHTERSQVTVRR